MKYDSVRVDLLYFRGQLFYGIFLSAYKLLACMYDFYIRRLISWDLRVVCRKSSASLGLGCGLLRSLDVTFVIGIAKFIYCPQIEVSLV